MDGIEHSVQVSADSLYEAIALGLRALHRNSWTGEIPKGLNGVTVSQLNPAVEHTVQMKVFQNWLAKKGGSPSERSARAKIKEILR
jgi:hypothetical protein